MTLQRTRRFAIGFFVAYAIAVVYPGVALLRGPRPFVLGMPLAMAWTAAWVAASFFVLLLLDRAYSRAQREYDAALGHDAGEGGRSAGGSSAGGRSPGGRSPGGRSPEPDPSATER
jgi:uncharacterized membrane protein YgcG